MNEHLAPPWLPRLVLALTVLAVVLIGAVTLVSLDTQSSTHEVERSSMMSACRDEAEALVDEARTEFDVARAERDTATSHLTVLVNEGLVAAVTDADDTLPGVFERLEAARLAVLDAEAVVVERTAALRAAGDRYRELVALSLSDPDAFLVRCGEV